MKSYKSHFLALSGDHGCLPDYFACCASREDAIQSLLCVFDDLSKAAIKELRLYGYLELKPEHGAAYCEVTECRADDLHDHLNDSEYKEFAESYPECIPQGDQDA